MTEKEIFEIENTRPHVVILGAGDRGIVHFSQMSR